MKKTLLIVTMLVVALGTLGVGTVAAQEGTPPYGSRGVADGTGTLHDYMVAAMADALGLSVADFEARHADETFYQIALAEGFTPEEIPALMSAARTDALNAAAKDGVITQEQADWMSSRGNRRGGMNAGNSYGNGTCTACDGTNVGRQGQDPAGNSFGRGGVRGQGK